MRPRAASAARRVSASGSIAFNASRSESLRARSMRREPQAAQTERFTLAMFGKRRLWRETDRLEAHGRRVQANRTAPGRPCADYSRGVKVVCIGSSSPVPRCRD